VDGSRNLLADLKARLDGIRAARDACNNARRHHAQAEEEAFKATGLALKAELARQIQHSTNATAKKRQDLEKRRRVQAHRVDRAYLRMKSRIESHYKAISGGLEKELRAASAGGAKIYQKNVADFTMRCENTISRLDALQNSAEDLSKRIIAFATTRGFQLDPDKLADEPEAPLVDSEEAIQQIEQRLAAADDEFSSPFLEQKRRSHGFLIFLIVIALHVGGAYAVHHKASGSPWIFAVAGSLVVAIGLLQTILSSSKHKLYNSSRGLLQDVIAVRGLANSQIVAVREELRSGLTALEGDEIHRICAIDEELEKKVETVKSKSSTEVSSLRNRRDDIAARITESKKVDLEAFQIQTDVVTKQIQARAKQAQEKAAEDHAARKIQIEQNANDTLRKLAEDWTAALAEFSAQCKSLGSAARAITPTWNELSEAHWNLPAGFTEQLYMGEMRVDLTKSLSGDVEGAFSVPPSEVFLPLNLMFPTRGCLYIRAGAAKRAEAMNMLMSTSLRMLCSFPAAKTKLTIIDPVGLGQNFGALMHLTDYDESIINSKIWSDAAQIERKLVELTEHIEKVIQKYLRNKYATIDEFNREAGQMAEPYRFLIIADFPSGLSELALERLASIVASGPKCGVYTLIHHDAAQRLPSHVPEMQLRANGLVVTEFDGKFFVEDPQLPRGEYCGPELVPANFVDPLINAVGKQCQEAARVQVPFEAAAPKAAEYWTSNSAQGVRLPLGMAGADRLQYLHLGKGTAQHALIAGKTGSGKSNLFHVIITNAALWYSPKELEFYLIDFKKGVEFKTYGEYQLPHARVVAIESDREFGLSVLRRIDKELSHRGELFRKARVQDFPSFRKASPDIQLPRTMLMVDEFQEFFTDDDVVAQDAALLLDRIVRQGRAFGIHVMLGSQTLGGTYTLAKSTIGQMAVRIALQCNESDSYMVLSDDNAAASLLTRPGEAIYNDQSGFVEGNNPFQAVFLPKEMQDGYLKVLQTRAAEEKYAQPEAQAIFEGNTLADLRNNRLLEKVVATGSSSEFKARVWLGEANAIKGPTEARFVRQAGSNLLVVGQRGDAALAAAKATVLGIAAVNAPADARILVLDGSGSYPEAGEKFAHMADALPHEVEVVPLRNVPQVMEELAGIVKGRQEGNGDSRQSIYLIVIGLERFRALREDDEFSFGSSSDSSSSSPAQHFAKVLSDGANEGVHSIVWCDTLSNLSRTLSRKTLREFEMRVLFQMSANDSSELIDSPAANRLGMYNAILFTAHNGAQEKFRPYAEPDAGYVEEVCRTLSKRYPRQARRARALTAPSILAVEAEDRGTQADEPDADRVSEITT
jgi:DNA segregation ATPase FtsK/SpoIIIE, S-DNA-T family